MDESAAGQTEGGRTSHWSGWLAGTLVAFVILAFFIALFRDDYNLVEELLLTGVPIGITVGALVWLLVDGPTLSRKRWNNIGLLIVVGFALYVTALVLCLAYQT